jgi:hypothetical protein
MAQTVRSGLSPLRPAFDLGCFVVDQMALGQVCLSVLLFSLVSIIPAMLNTRINLHVPLTRRTKGRSLGTFQKEILSLKSKVINLQAYLSFL